MIVEFLNQFTIRAVKTVAVRDVKFSVGSESKPRTEMQTVIIARQNAENNFRVFDLRSVSAQFSACDARSAAVCLCSSEKLQKMVESCLKFGLRATSNKPPC